MAMVSFLSVLFQEQDWFTIDPAILGLGVKPGDMIKITRSSPTAGESLYYRYVVEI